MEMLTNEAAIAIQAYAEEIDNLDSIDLMELQMLVEDAVGNNATYESQEMAAFVRLIKAKHPASYRMMRADTSPELLAYLERIEVQS
jgi:hypothetical protein